MKWMPAACKAGDVIRVQLGKISHFGIFVSDDEVIQFGLPPIPQYKDHPDRVRVVATDIATFSCGMIVEKAVYDRAEQKAAFPRGQIVERARARLGEGGYNIFHNNCEHFVNECAFGVRRSQMEEEARRRWLSRPVLDVYVMTVPDMLPDRRIMQPARRAAIESCRNAELRKYMTADWLLLETAIRRSFSLELSDLNPVKRPSGKWTCDRVHFSLTHTENLVAVAVSDRPVGIDAENLASLTEKYARLGTPPEKVIGKILSKEESYEPTDDRIADLAYLWTAKEAAFKKEDKSRFIPSKITVRNESVVSRLFVRPERTVLSVCSEHAGREKYFISDLERTVMADASYFEPSDKTGGEERENERI